MVGSPPPELGEERGEGAVGPGGEGDFVLPVCPSARLPVSGPCRLGYAVKTLGGGGLKEADHRRWQSGPHLRVSLGYVAAIFAYLAEHRIRMYRLSSDLAPYVTHPDLPQFHNQIADCAAELAALGEQARRQDLRLSIHPSQYIVLNSPDERIAAAAAADFAAHAAILDGLGTGPEAKIVTHAGGVYGDRAAAAGRFVARYLALPEAVRRRLVLENDERSWGVADILAIHARCGIPLVFDILHHRCHDPAGLSPEEACNRCLATWSAGQVPKIHFSSQRRAPRPGAAPGTLRPAKPGQHDEWIDPADFIAFLRATEDVRYDVMLEAKQKDLALLRLREAIAAAGLADRIW